MVLLDPGNKTVLIVEDDEHVRDAIAEALRDEGYTVRIAANGREALAALGTGQSEPRLILLDLAMPVMDGAELYQRLRADTRFAATPVIIATSQPSRAPVGVPLMKKPIQFDRLLGLIQSR